MNQEINYTKLRMRLILILSILIVLLLGWIIKTDMTEMARIHSEELVLICNGKTVPKELVKYKDDTHYIFTNGYAAIQNCSLRMKELL